MRVKVTFKELTDFYATFIEPVELIKVDFSEVSMRYIGVTEEYNGPYNVVPKVEPQTLQTAQKTLTQDVKVFAIPYAEVSNQKGGITATIGGN